MTLGMIIGAYCQRQGISYRKFAELSGLTSGYISMLVNGKNPNTGKPLRPTLDTYIKLADTMHISINELFKIMDDAPVILNSDVPKLNTKRIPIIGDTAAGQPIIANREYDEYIEVPIDGRRFDAAVRVTGDSMEPGYHIGDLALVRYQEDVEDGQIAVVCLDDEVTLKRIHHMTNGIILQSDNTKYKTQVVTTDYVNNIHLMGRVVGVIHWEE